MSNISLFNIVANTKDPVDIPVYNFITKIIAGTWQDDVLPIRAIANKKERDAAKTARLPGVTISGKFSERTSAGLIEHSGYMAIDIDDLEPADAPIVRDSLAKDKYTYAAFISVSGRGVCAVYKINPEKHLESFEGLQAYLFNNYKIVIDTVCKDVTRFRFVSYDPEAYLNESCQTFKQYPKKEKKQIVQQIVFIQSDFENIIQQIEERGLDITNSYKTWLQIAFALSDKFQEEGRSYFHRISIFNANYDAKLCDKQYSAALNAGKQGITIATFYHLCKKHNITLGSEDTRRISKYAAENKLAGLSKIKAAQNIKKFGGAEMDEELIDQIVEQIFSNDIPVEEISDIESAKLWLRENYSIKFNELTKQNEVDGKIITNRERKTIELLMKERFDLDYQTIERIFSSTPDGYHPIFSFIQKYSDRQPRGVIDQLFDTIDSPTGCDCLPLDGDYVKYFGKKWLVGMIACLYEDVSPLMLVLCGEKIGTGKSWFFQNLLPLELKDYFTKKDLSSLSMDSMKKDLDISISKHWLVLDDELGGKSKRDMKTVKAFLSSTYTSIRGAYEQSEERRKRIAAFAGTSNDLHLLYDDTENRRIIPIEVDKIDQETKDRIDPIDYIIEAYHLYNEGFEYRVLGKDIEILKNCTPQFKAITMEYEMLTQYYAVPKSEDDPIAEYLTATQIKNTLDGLSKERMNANRLAHALKEMGIKSKRTNKAQLYHIIARGFGMNFETRIPDTPF